MAGTDLDTVAMGYESLDPAVREHWAIEQVKTIRNTVAKDLTPAEFQMGMAIAAKYDLDPLTREIWFTKGRTRDGNPGRVMIMVGRDGLLKIARRTTKAEGRLLGLDGDVVREKDEFRVERRPDGERGIHHSWSGGPEARGKIVGAWSEVRREGVTPVFYFASIEEYRPTNPKQLEHSPWGSQESVMILKCAHSYVLRIGFGITGVVGEEEASRQLSEMAAGPEMDTEVRWHPEVSYELRERALNVADRGNAQEPNRHTPAGLQMALSSQPPAYVERWVTENWVEPFGEPPDAEVVPEGDPDVQPDEVQFEAPTEESAGAESPVEEAAAEAPPPDVESLRHRLSNLYDLKAAAEADGDENDLAEIDAEIDHVEARLSAAGAELPGQGNLL